MDKKTAFDYVGHKSLDTYTMTLRVVRLPISGTGHECLVTNLPAGEFPLERPKGIYFMRWPVMPIFF